VFRGVNSSSNDAAIAVRRLLPALTPRLGAALAASLALHAYALSLLEALPTGARHGDFGALESGQRVKPFRVGLRPESPAWVPPVAPALPPSPVAESPASDREQPGQGSAPSPAFPAPPVQHHYKTSELDVQPGILVRVEPDYPEAAARRFLSGRVVARLLIDETGAVERVVIVGSEPPGYFEDSATRAFMAARFTPGMKGGRAVRVQLLLEITFDAPPPKLPPNVAS
jgi:TonB family protein